MASAAHMQLLCQLSKIGLKLYEKTRAETHASECVHSRLGPNTIAILPGVILLASWYSVSLARNLIKYLWKIEAECELKK